MRRIFFLTLVCSLIIIACEPENPTNVIHNPSLIPTSSLTPTPPVIIFPTETITKQVIETPESLNIPFGKVFYTWGAYYDWSKTTDPYLVWGANLRDIMDGDCQGFICEGKDLREFDNVKWKFLGSGKFGKSTFTFDEPLDTFVMTWNNPLGIDSFSGVTKDGRMVAYGYLANGEVTASYADGGGMMSFKTILDAEANGLPILSPCGIIDPSPDGDNNYLVTGEYQGWFGGALVWNFLDQPFSSAFSTRKGYSLVSLTIVTQPLEKITADQICP